MITTITERIQEMSQEYGKKIAVSMGDWFINYTELVNEIDKEATKLKKAAQRTACLGVRTRVETTVAMEFAESWKPLIKSKTYAVRTIKMTINNE